MRGKPEGRIALLAIDSKEPLEEVINCRAVLPGIEPSATKLIAKKIVMLLPD